MGNSKRREVSQEIRHGAGPAMEFLPLIPGQLPVAKRKNGSIELISLGSDPAGWCASWFKTQPPTQKEHTWWKTLKSDQLYQNWRHRACRGRKVNLSSAAPVGFILLTGSCPCPLTWHMSTPMSAWTSTLASETALVPVIGPFLSARAHPLHPAMPMAFVLSHSVVSHSATPWTPALRLLCPWDSSGKNTGVGCHALLQKIFRTQGSNPGLPHCRQILYHMSHQGSPGCL